MWALDIFVIGVSQTRIGIGYGEDMSDIESILTH